MKEGANVAQVEYVAAMAGQHAIHVRKRLKFIDFSNLIILFSLFVDRLIGWEIQMTTFQFVLFYFSILSSFSYFHILQISIYDFTLTKGQSAQFASVGSGEYGSNPQNAILMGKIDGHKGVVEVETEFQMKMVDGEGHVAMGKMKEIVEDVEMCILDSRGQQMAGILFVFFKKQKGNCFALISYNT